MKCLADHVVPHPYDELTPAAGSAYPMEDQHLNRARRPKTPIKEVGDGIWLVSFMLYDLGCNPAIRYEPVTYVLSK